MGSIGHHILSAQECSPSIAKIQFREISALDCSSRNLLELSVIQAMHDLHF